MIREASYIAPDGSRCGLGLLCPDREAAGPVSFPKISECGDGDARAYCDAAGNQIVDCATEAETCRIFEVLGVLAAFQSYGQRAGCAGASGRVCEMARSVTACLASRTGCSRAVCGICETALELVDCITTEGCLTIDCGDPTACDLVANVINCLNSSGCYDISCEQPTACTAIANLLDCVENPSCYTPSCERECQVVDELIATVNRCATDAATCAAISCTDPMLCSVVGAVNAVLTGCAADVLRCGMTAPIAYEEGESQNVTYPPDEEDQRERCEQEASGATTGVNLAVDCSSIVVREPGPITINHGIEQMFFGTNGVLLYHGVLLAPNVAATDEPSTPAGTCDLQTNDRIKFKGTFKQRGEKHPYGFRRFVFVHHKFNRAHTYRPPGGQPYNFKRWINCATGVGDPNPDRDGNPLTKMKWVMAGTTAMPYTDCGADRCYEVNRDILYHQTFSTGVESGRAVSKLDVALNVGPLTFSNAAIQTAGGGTWDGVISSYDSRLKNPRMETFNENTVSSYWEVTDPRAAAGATAYRSQTLQAMWELRQVHNDPPIEQASRYRSCVYTATDTTCKEL